MTYSLGLRSIVNLRGVHPDLVRVVRRAISLTSQDFTVFEGLRTLARQKELVAAGASQTLNSQHIKQADGYGHAVDLVGYIKGLRWDWQLCWPVCTAMRVAADEERVRIRWGGAWNVCLNDSIGSPEEVSHQYALWARANGKKPFLDGYHYEIQR